MALSLRPFGGLFNPYAKGCSVLCNHPAPAEVKHVINQCKQNLVSLRYVPFSFYYIFVFIVHRG